MRLLKVELTRLRWRRAVLLLLAAAFVVPVVIGVATVWNTRPPSQAELDRIDRLVAEETERPRTQRQLERCLDKPNQYGIDADADDLQAQCEEMVLPQPEWFGYYQELSLANEQDEGSGLAVVVVVTLLLSLVGTTFVGHDWNSGSMSNQLLFEPRRARVWLAKALVLMTGAFTVAVVVLSSYWLAMYAVARSRDLPVDRELLVDCLQHGLRGAAIAAFAALGGYALTMLFRSTVATLGVLFAVGIGAGILIGVLGISQRWQPQVNLLAVVTNGTTYYVVAPDECYSMRPPDDPALCDETRTLSATQGGGYLGALLVVATVPSLLSFRRRDVP